MYVSERLGPEWTAATSDFGRAHQQHEANPEELVRHLSPSLDDRRKATLTPPAVSMHPASDTSQLISALDIESLHGDPQRQLHSQSPAGQSLSSEGEIGSNTSFRSNGDGYGQRQEHQGWSGSGNGSEPLEDLDQHTLGYQTSGPEDNFTQPAVGPEGHLPASGGEVSGGPADEYENIRREQNQMQNAQTQASENNDNAGSWR